MIAILTGDIIKSDKVSAEKWTQTLKALFNTIGKTPKVWEIYRGDEFQIELTNIYDALMFSIHIKTTLKSIHGMDVRISIGIGEKEYNSKKITESNGSAFVRSGRNFDDLKKTKTTLKLSSGNNELDEEINLMLRLALSGFMDTWSVASAEMVRIMLDNQAKTQVDIAKEIDLNQSAISRRLKRANFDLIQELNEFYIKKMKQTFV